jgi:hypothetical protein
MISQYFKTLYINSIFFDGASIEDMLAAKEKTELGFKKRVKAERKFLKKNKGMASCYDYMGALNKAKQGDLFNTYFKFTIVRNPWDRIASVYDHLFGEDTVDHEKFTSWVKKISSSRKNLNQYNLIYDKNEESLLDFIGKYENLDTGYTYLKSKINNGSELDVTEKQLATTSYTKYYNQETIDLIANLCSKDIEHFSYDFNEIKSSGVIENTPPSIKISNKNSASDLSDQDLFDHLIACSGITPESTVVEVVINKNTDNSINVFKEYLKENYVEIDINDLINGDIPENSDYVVVKNILNKIKSPKALVKLLKFVDVLKTSNTSVIFTVNTASSQKKSKINRHTGVSFSEKNIVKLANKNGWVCQPLTSLTKDNNMTYLISSSDLEIPVDNQDEAEVGF